SKQDMNKRNQVSSPFLEDQPIRLGFNIMLLLLLMVVAAGMGLLAYFAVQVPAITSEFSAWLGRSPEGADLDDARWAQLRFALCLYCAPMLLGIFVYVLHYAANAIYKLSTKYQRPEDEEFRME
ncbi:MAG: hypothetical protein AAF483_30435, partial [Planctomycetota bacterium]